MLKVLTTAQAWSQEDHDVMLATVVETWGSSPRAPGSYLAVDEQGRIAGSVSAGCVEGEVIQRMLAARAKHETQLLSFTASDKNAWEVGLPCGGDIQILIMPYDKQLHTKMADLASRDLPFVSVTLVDKRHRALGAQALVSTEGVVYSQRFSLVADPLCDAALAAFVEAGGLVENRPAPSCPSKTEGMRPTNYAYHSGIYEVYGTQVLVCRHEPRPTLICVGAVQISLALVALARTVGYRTAIVDPRRAFAQQEGIEQADLLISRWPEQAFDLLDIDSATAICALTHDPKIDVAALREGLSSRAFYLGCLGSIPTLRTRAEALLEEGIATEQLKRIHGPIGLTIGGRTPEEIALSVLAQINAVRFGALLQPEAIAGHTLGTLPPPIP